MKRTLLLTMMSLFLATTTMAAVDPNFYVYICFGQSNMEGQAQASALEKKSVDERFQMMACVDFTNPQRTKGQWYPAYTPIVRQWTNVGPADYFGRTMVAALPAEAKVGVINVAIGGVDIKGFLSDQVADYVAKEAPDYMISAFKEYGNNPYQRIVDMAKIAQQSGVIKGVLLHQGETNTGQQDWPNKVKTIYERLLKDLDLKAADVPLLVGEVVGSDVGGVCASHNAVIAKVPEVIPTAHVISSVGCPCASDNIHFTLDGYRTMGKRYAYEALRLLGKETKAQADYKWNADMKKIYTLQKLNDVDDIVIRVGGSKVLTLWGTFADGHQENLTAEAVFTSNDFTIENGMVKGNEAKKGVVTASYQDFTGNTLTKDIQVEVSATADNHVLTLVNGAAQTNAWDYEAFCKLAKPLEKNKTYIVKVTLWGEKGGNCTLWPRYDASTNRDQWGNSADIQYLDTKAITKEPQEFTWTFTANHPHDVLIFAIGQIGGKIYVDDISCVEQGTTTERIANGNFESDDITNWSVLGYTGQTLSQTTDPIATSIQTMRTTPVANDGAIYTLQGTKVAEGSQWSSLPVGTYIRNGHVHQKSASR